MLPTKNRSPLAVFGATAIVAALFTLPAAASFSPAALFAADGEGRSPAYRDAQRALDEARWEEAARRFASVAGRMLFQRHETLEPVPITSKLYSPALPSRYKEPGT